MLCHSQLYLAECVGGHQHAGAALERVALDARAGHVGAGSIKAVGAPHPAGRAINVVPAEVADAADVQFRYRVYRRHVSTNAC